MYAHPDDRYIEQTRIRWKYALKISCLVSLVVAEYLLAGIFLELHQPVPQMTPLPQMSGKARI